MLSVRSAAKAFEIIKEKEAVSDSNEIFMDH
jgi:hypothetical protein